MKVVGFLEEPVFESCFLSGARVGLFFVLVQHQGALGGHLN